MILAQSHNPVGTEGYLSFFAHENYAVFSLGKMLSILNEEQGTYFAEVANIYGKDEFLTV